MACGYYFFKLKAMKTWLTIISYMCKALNTIPCQFNLHDRFILKFSSCSYEVEVKAQ